MKTIFSLFLLITVSALATSPATGQEAQKIPRIGLLVSGTALANKPNRDAFLQGLKELGYIDGKNLIIEHRYANGKRDLLQQFAADLVRLNVAVIVPSGPTAVRPAMKATKSIAIVMPNGGDPLARGFVKNLARPDGNVTGMAGIAQGITAKRLELIKEALSPTSRVVVLVPDQQSKVLGEEYARAGRELGVAVDMVNAFTREEIDQAFHIISKNPPDALIIMRNTLTLGYAKQIGDFAVKIRVATMNEMEQFAKVGGLMSYAVSLTTTWHRAAVFVGKILKGAKPADLPVEPPPKFEFVINLKTADKIGVTIPPEILLEANEVIR